MSADIRWRWRETRAILSRRDRAERGETAYRIYLFIAGVLVFGIPFVRAIIIAAAPSGTAALLVPLIEWLCVIAPIACVAFGPRIGIASADLADIAFLVRGPFTTARVVGARVVGLTLFSAVSAGGIVATITWSVGVPLATVSYLAALATAVTALSCALAVGGQSAKKWVAWAVSAVVAGAVGACLTAKIGVGELALWWVVAGIAVVGAAVLASIFLRGVTAFDLEVSATGRETLSRSLITGEMRALEVQRPPRWRGAVLRIPTGMCRSIIAADVLSLVRRRPAALASVVLLTAGCAGAIIFSTSPLLSAVFVVAATLCLGTLTRPFRDELDGAGGDHFYAGSPAARAWSHVIVPAGIVVLAGALAAALVPFFGAGVPLAALLVALVALFTRLWLSGAANAPVMTASPVPTPMGDFSGVVHLLVVARGGIPAVVYAIAAAQLGVIPGLLIAFALAAILTLNAVSKAREK